MEYYCKQQNLGFITNDNINKSELAAKSLKEERSCKLTINFKKTCLEVIQKVHLLRRVEEEGSLKSEQKQTGGGGPSM